MPLIKSSSPAAFKDNLKAELSAGKPRAQALAIAYDVQRRNRADGGVVRGYDMGGPVNPQLMAAMMGSQGGMQGLNKPQMGLNPATGVAPGNPMPPMPTTSVAQQVATPPMSPMGVAPGVNNPMLRPLMARGGALHRAEGGFNMAKGPHLAPPWQMKNEIRGMHTGPILSAVPGRTDSHSAHVPSGSYVIPADIVSGRGQGNTIAGSNTLQRMFKMGPYGTSMPSMGHGHLGAPKMAGMMHAGGGKGGDHVGKPVPVMLAGGEIVIPPENLMKVVHPDLHKAHQIMDAWVIHERKNLRKTLAKLPGPAKD